MSASRRPCDHRRVPLFPMPAGGYGLHCCKWCGEPIPIVIDGRRCTTRLWHPDCVADFVLHSRPDQQFAFLADRDGERCAWPDCGAQPMRWQAGAPSPLLDYRRGRDIACYGSDDLWPAGLLPRWTDTDPDRIRATLGMRCEISRVSALEVDHRVPLWSVRDLDWRDRRPFHGPGNLWLLCPAHHKAKTRAEAAQRAAIKKSTTSVDLA